VFRTLVLTLALTLTAAPHAALLCQVWCARAATPVAGCHHAGGTDTRVAAVASACDEAGAGVMAVLREGSLTRGTADRQALLRAAVVPGTPAPPAEARWSLTGRDGTRPGGRHAPTNHPLRI